MSEMNFPFILGAFGVALVLTFLMTPVAKSFAYKIGAIDVPKDTRRMHKKPIPRLGGLAIFMGFFISVLIFSYDFINSQIRGFLIGAVIIVVLGIFDDVLALHSLPKFFVQIIASMVPVFFKVRITSIPNMFGETAYKELPIFLQYFISIVWILAILNAINLIDGLDGLAVGVSAIMSVCVLAILIIISAPAIAIIAAALTGACMGFIPYNKNPAKLFMGDTGAMFIGYTLACLSIMGLFKAYTIISIAVPILIFGLPIFDMGFAAIRRILSGKSPMSADKGHLHHKLIDVGFSQKQAVAILYVISTILGLTAVLMTDDAFIRSITVVILTFVIVILGSVLMYKRRKRKNDEDNEQEDSDEKD